jgi:RNA polymerase sigma factor (TIGR02999 family)
VFGLRIAPCLGNDRRQIHFRFIPGSFIEEHSPGQRPMNSDLTQILDQMQRGDPHRADELLPLVYEELRKLAGAKMAHQPFGQTLQATALVHEAWLRLSADPATSWSGRQHFFRAAAEAMRHILIDRARRRLRLKRGGPEAERVPLENVEIVAPAKEEILLELDEALGDLAKISPERAELVKLRFFAGLEEKEIAEVLGISERSVQRQWSYARAWLFAKIGSFKIS